MEFGILLVVALLVTYGIINEIKRYHGFSYGAGLVCRVCLRAPCAL